MKKARFRIVCLMLAVMMVFMAVPTSAFNNENALHVSRSTASYTLHDVKALESFVSVDLNGNLVFDVESARRSRTTVVDEEMFFMLQKHFDNLNAEFAKGSAVISENLEIEIVSDDFFKSFDIPFANDMNDFAPASEGACASWCRGGRRTNPQIHWWGVSRYLCDCVTQAQARSFRNAGDVTQGIALVSTLFKNAPLAVGAGLFTRYFNRLGDDLDWHNRAGRGVFIEMTWILAYSIRSQ